MEQLDFVDSPVQSELEEKEAIRTFNDAVIEFAEQEGMDVHVVATLRVQRNLYSLAEAAKTIEDKERADTLLESFTRSNKDLVEKANEVRRTLVSKLSK